IDMKGFDVGILLSRRALRDARQLDRMNITIVMTGDEESSGRTLTAARAALVAPPQGAAAAMGFEDGDGEAAHAVTARRGPSSWQLTVSGSTGHSSQIFPGDVWSG